MARKAASNVVEFPGEAPPPPEPLAPPTLPAPKRPAWLTDPLAREAWDRIVKALDGYAVGYLSSIDGEQLALVVMHLPLAKAAIEQIRSGPARKPVYEILTHDAAHKGAPRRHPGLLAFREEAKAYLEGMDRLGLTPKVRRALELGIDAFLPDEVDDDGDDLYDA